MPAPKNVKQPTDHQAKAEAKSDHIIVEFDGATYTIPRQRADNVELFELLEDEKNVTATRAFLGDEQWKAFKDSVRTPDNRVPTEPMERFLNKLMAAIGGGSDESPNS